MSDSYHKLPTISNRTGFPLHLPLFDQSFTMGYSNYVSWTQLFEHPTISNYFFLSLAQIKPSYHELITVWRSTCQMSVRECIQDTVVSWRDMYSTERWEIYWCVHSTNAKSDWLDFLLRIQGKLQYKLVVFITFWDRIITPEISKPHYLERVFLDALESLRYQGSQYTVILFCIHQNIAKETSNTIFGRSYFMSTKYISHAKTTTITCPKHMN